MLRFCGFDLELLIDDVISREEWPALCEAHDEAGAHWLIVQVDADQDHPAWLCAPVSRRAIRAVLDGRASPRDVLCHSATGTVELVRVSEGRAVPDRCLLCSEVDQRLSSPAGCRGEIAPGEGGSGGSEPSGGELGRGEPGGGALGRGAPGQGAPGQGALGRGQPSGGEPGQGALDWGEPGPAEPAARAAGADPAPVVLAA